MLKFNEKITEPLLNYFFKFINKNMRILRIFITPLLLLWTKNFQTRSQLTVTCSTLTTETLEKDVKYVQG